jgi:hypothetical protein
VPSVVASVRKASANAFAEVLLADAGGGGAIFCV